MFFPKILSIILLAPVLGAMAAPTQTLEERGGRSGYNSVPSNTPTAPQFGALDNGGRSGYNKRHGDVVLVDRQIV
ncbi:hypothetical protein GGTG_09334 [Gaeumannomyces tritici R3-111a-1]|uniref:Uncharacterized protein n=1 Tax=Gaeumannomyces tritici (strain R3-111a-1) TaxID=644352 RepID=J3P737_GAET3|nr:hypothetical protein GGTG_09334 [Gaeumannomyces tritici R3-111a-1]EJT72468.1 hypothetical protein GGTG_09334 [Gaeumannomyces tritici R3-111a-1]